jgi:hypothetical protein
MTDISYEQSAGRQSAGRSDRSRDNGLRMLTRTETRRAFLTTEFWLAIAMAAAVIVAAYKNDGRNIGIDQAWALGSGIIAFYVLSRGVAKAGSSDPEVRDLD